MEIVDARCRPPLRYFSDQVMYRNRARTLANMRARGFEPTAAIEEMSLPAFREEMKSAGISHAMVPARVPNEMFGGAENDDLFRECSELPELSVLGAVAIDDHAPEAVAALHEAGVVGIVVEPGLAPEPMLLDDHRVFPVYDACAQLDLPVYAMGGGNAGPDLAYSNPLALDRVAAAFPTLQIVAVHGGWPWAQETLGVAFRRQNVWILPDLYFPGMPGEGDYLIALRGFLQDRFLFATAYPFCPLAQHVQRYTQLGLNEVMLEKVLGGNVRRLFRLDERTRLQEVEP